MSELLRNVSGGRTHSGLVPAGFETPHDLVFDDDPIGKIVYEHRTDGATPADILDLVQTGRWQEVAEDEIIRRALLSLLASDPQLLAAVRATRGDEQFAELVAAVWRFSPQERGSTFPLGIWLGLHSRHLRRGLQGEQVWKDLPELYRGTSDPDVLQSYVSRVLETLDAEARTYWECEERNPNTNLGETLRLLRAIDSGDDQVEVGDDPALGIPGLADVLRRTAVHLTRIGNGEARENLGAWTRACLAVAAETSAADYPNHPFVGDCLNRLFLLILRHARDPAALALGKKAMNIRSAAFGEGHPLTAQSQINLGGACLLLDDLDAAGQHLDAAGQHRDAAGQYLAPLHVPDAENTHAQYWLARFYQARADVGDARLEAEAWRNFLNHGSAAAGRRWEATRRLRELES